LTQGIDPILDPSGPLILEILPGGNLISSQKARDILLLFNAQRQKVRLGRDQSSGSRLGGLIVLDRFQHGFLGRKIAGQRRLKCYLVSRPVLFNVVLLGVRQIQLPPDPRMMMSPMAMLAVA
jgi:hypothetical protein